MDDKGMLTVVPAGEVWLDLGCGPNKFPGALGLDMFDLPGVDIVHDLESYPWPFPDNSFDRVICRHSLSHLNDLIKVMAELHRVLRPGGFLEILAPHYASDNFNTDPTHKIAMGYRTVNYFCENVPFRYSYYSNARFRLVRRYLSFRNNRTDFCQARGMNPFRWVGLEQFVNAMPRLYERFFVYWLPPSELYFKMQTVK